MGRLAFEDFPRAIDDDGNPVAGAKMYIYEAGSTTPVTTYSDASYTFPQDNPIPSDAAGYFPQVYIKAAGYYKVRMLDNSDVLLYDADFVDQGADGDASGAVASLADFGADPDLDDNADAFTAANAYIEATPPGTLYIPAGHYKTTVALANTRGVNVVGQGKVVLEPIGSDRAYTVGSSTGLTVTSAAVSEGDTEFTFSSTPTVMPVAGDIIRVMSSLSTNSSGSNDIWKYKDWLKVQSVSGLTVTLDTPFRWDHDPTDDMEVALINCVGGTTENITVMSLDGVFTGSYPWHVSAAYGHTFRHFHSQRSASFVVGSDKIAFYSCDLQGYSSGASTARGTGRVSYRDCTLRVAPAQPDGNALYVEESPDKVYLENCDFFGAIRFAANSDNTPPKNLIIRGGRVFAPGEGLSMVGAYNADGYALDIEDVTFYAPGGGASSYSGNQAVICIAYADSARVVGCRFPDVDAAKYIIAASNIGTFRLEYHGNEDGGLGVDASLASSGVDIEFLGDLEAAGLRLPASSGATQVTANFLETKSTTPTFYCDSTDFDSVTIDTTSKWRAVKFGPMVFYKLYLRVNSLTKGSASGNVRIGNAPYTCRSNSSGLQDGIAPGAVGLSTGLPTTAPTFAQMAAGSTYMELRKQATAGALTETITAADVSSFGSAEYITVSGWYETAS